MLIVLDTNIFCAEADPEEAASLKTLLALAEDMKTPIRIPEPCEIEAREVYRRELRKAITQVKAAKQNAVRVAELEIDEGAEVEAYEQRLKKFSQAHRIGTIPFPHFPDLRKLFELAAKKEMPFDASGNNFRDAVIYLAVSQFAGGVEGPLLLVTGDKPFRGVVNADVRIKPVTLQEAIEELKTKLSKAKAHRRAELNKRLAAAVRERFAEIAKIAGGGEKPFLNEVDLRILVVRVDEVLPEEVLKVEAAETSGRRTAFTATIKAQVRCTVRPHHPPLSLLGSDHVIEQKQVLPVQLAVEGEVTLDAKGNVQNIVFKPEVRGLTTGLAVAMAREIELERTRSFINALRMRGYGARAKK